MRAILGLDEIRVFQGVASRDFVSTMYIQNRLLVKSPHLEIATAHRIKKQFSSVPSRRRRKKIRVGSELAEKVF